MQQQPRQTEMQDDLEPLLAELKQPLLDLAVVVKGLLYSEPHLRLQFPKMMQSVLVSCCH